MRSATVLGRAIQTGTLISYSIRGDARLGSTLRAASVQTDPDYPKSSHKSVSMPLDRLRSSRVVEIDILADPARLDRLNLPPFEP